MNPTCAACLRPIEKGRGGKVTIVGTEAFHQRCVLAGSSVNSVNAKLERSVRELRSANASLSRKIIEDREDKQRVDAMEIWQRNEALVTERDRRVRAERDLETIRYQLEEQRRATAEATADASRLRTELALERAMPAPVVTVSAPNPTPAEKKQEKTESVDEDGTAIRFGLIELS